MEGYSGPNEIYRWIHENWDKLEPRRQTDPALVGVKDRVEVS